MERKRPKNVNQSKGKIAFQIQKSHIYKLLGQLMPNVPQKCGRIMYYFKLHVFYVKPLPPKADLS